MCAYFEVTTDTMAKKHFLLPTKLVNRMPALRKLAWLIEAAVVKSLVALIRLMPLRRSYQFANALLRSLKPILPFTARIRRNLTIAFPNKDPSEIERLTRAVCGNLGSAMVDLALAGRIWAERGQRIEYVIEEGVDLASYRGRGLVFVISHVGAWQLCTFVAAHYGLQVTTVYAPEENPYLKDFLARMRATMPVNWISRDGCMRQLSKELRNGGIVGLAADTRSGSSELVDFFGVPTAANNSAARLALNNRCDLIPVRTERLAGPNFRITVGKPIVAADPDAPGAERVRQMTADMIKQFEAWIRSDPSQWICFSRYWPAEVYQD